MLEASEEDPGLSPEATDSADKLSKLLLLSREDASPNSPPATTPSCTGLMCHTFEFGHTRHVHNGCMQYITLYPGGYMASRQLW